MEGDSFHAEDAGMAIPLQIFVPGGEIFKLQATSDLLSVLANHRDGSFPIREIARQIDTFHTVTGDAVDLLLPNDLVEEERPDHCSDFI